MDLLRDTIMIIGIPPAYHATLVRWAAERNSKNPDLAVKVEAIAEQAILEYVDRMEQTEANLKPTGEAEEIAPSSANSDSAASSQTKGSLSSPENRQK